MTAAQFDDAEGHALVEAIHERKAATICEAQRRNQKALYILENEWGCGRIDVGKLQRLLRGDEPDTCCTNTWT
jgi:hypothetical protein